MDSQVPCERGCRFYGIQKMLEGPATEPSDLLSHCKQDCLEAYTEQRLAQCSAGCEGQHAISQAAAPLEESQRPWLGPIAQVQETFVRMLGEMRLQTSRMLTFFVRGNETMVVVGPQRTFLMDAGAFAPSEDKDALGEDTEGRYPEDSEGSSEDSLDAMFQQLLREAEGGETQRGGPTVERISRRRAAVFALWLNVAAVVATVAVFVCAVSMLLRLRRGRNQGLKQANLSIAVQQEPLKLVRPEDLTKLSLIEDDVPGTLHLPSARV